MKLDLEDDDLEDDTDEPVKVRVLVAGLSGVFVAVFIMLKLTGLITISWWWILLCILCD